MTKQQYPGNTGNRHGKTVVSFLLWTGHHSIGLHLTGAASGRPTVSGWLGRAYRRSPAGRRSLAARRGWHGVRNDTPTAKAASDRWGSGRRPCARGKSSRSQSGHKHPIGTTRDPASGEHPKTGRVHRTQSALCEFFASFICLIELNCFCREVCTVRVHHAPFRVFRSRSYRYSSHEGTYGTCSRNGA